MTHIARFTSITEDQAESLKFNPQENYLVSENGRYEVKDLTNLEPKGRSTLVKIIAIIPVIGWFIFCIFSGESREEAEERVRAKSFELITDAFSSFKGDKEMFTHIQAKNATKFCNRFETNSSLNNTVRSIKLVLDSQKSESVLNTWSQNTCSQSAPARNSQTTDTREKGKKRAVQSAPAQVRFERGHQRVPKPKTEKTPLLEGQTKRDGLASTASGSAQGLALARAVHVITNKQGLVEAGKVTVTFADKKQFNRAKELVHNLQKHFEDMEARLAGYQTSRGSGSSSRGTKLAIYDKCVFDEANFQVVGLPSSHPMLANLFLDPKEESFVIGSRRKKYTPQEGTLIFRPVLSSDGSSRQLNIGTTDFEVTVSKTEDRAEKGSRQDMNLVAAQRERLKKTGIDTK